MVSAMEYIGAKRNQCAPDECVSCGNSVDDGLGRVSACDLVVDERGHLCPKRFRKMRASGQWPDLCPHRGSSSAAKT